MGRAKKQVSDPVLKEFIRFVTELHVVSIKKTSRVDETGEMVPYQEEIIEKPFDFKAALALFEKRYPDQLDPITVKRMEQIEANIGGDSREELSREIMEAFK